MGICDKSVVRSHYIRSGKKACVVKNPPNFVIVMEACMSVLIASSEPFPDHADNTFYCNNHVSAMVEYLLNWDSSYEEKENKAPTTAEDVKFASTLMSFVFVQMRNQK